MWFYASYSQQFQYIAYIVTWKYLGLGWYTRKKANGVTYDLKIRNMLNLDVLLVSVKDDPDDAVRRPWSEEDVEDYIELAEDDKDELAIANRLWKIERKL